MERTITDDCVMLQLVSNELIVWHNIFTVRHVYIFCCRKNPPDRENCNNPCRITFCHACYYSDDSLEVPEHCESCSFYPNMNQTETQCFKRWAICARRSVFPKVQLLSKINLPSYQCCYIHVLYACSIVEVKRRLKRGSNVLNIHVFSDSTVDVHVLW